MAVTATALVRSGTAPAGPAAAWPGPVGERLLLVGVVLVGTTFRVVGLTTVGYNSDEAVYAGQGLSLAGDSAFQPYFPVFRAHPLLFQSVLAAFYSMAGFSELTGRLVSAAFGIATVVVVFAVGRRLYSPAVGLLAGLLMAVMPYSVVVTRQVLLDGPMALFAALTVYLLVRFCEDRRTIWLCAAAATMGLTILTKETAVLLLGGIYAFFALTASVRVRWRQVLAAAVVLAGVVLVYPLSVTLAGAGRTGGNFLVWQLLRRANHTWGFYPQVVPAAIGWPVVITAVAGLWFLRRRGGWREALLGYWVLGPVLFFELWAVKGYQYLLPIAAPLAVLAARAFVAFAEGAPAADQTRVAGLSVLSRRLLTHWGRTLGAAVAVILTTALLVWQSWSAIAPSEGEGTFLAGSGGVPGGREAGRWVGSHVPEGAQLLCLGPSMANIISFYGHRKAFGLSVSPNPLHRNPVYEPIHNPDNRIRENDLQFLVWDSYSADRSPFFSKHLLDYAKAYHGRVVHTEYATAVRDGQRVRIPIIVVYQVRP